MDRRAFLSTAAVCSLVSASGLGARAQTRRRFTDAEAYSAEHNGAAFLVARHGVVLAESYPGAGPDARLPIGAGTRTFAALLAATLVEDELMTLDEPVAMTLGEWGLHPVKSTVSIRTLLNGTSGIGFGRSNDRSFAAATTLEPSDAPGLRFQDDPAPYVLLAEIARRKLVSDGREADPARYLSSETLAPIGCSAVGWARGGDGAVRFDDGAAVSARGWAQVGELIRREGVWRAQQLANASALREVLRGSFAEPRAGIGLWLATPGRVREDLDIDSDLWRARSPAPIGLAMAAGEGGQRLYISPAEGLVIVRQSRSTDRARWSDAEFLTLVYRDL